MTETTQTAAGAPKTICFYSPYSGRGNISGTRIRLEMLSHQLSTRGVQVHIIGPFDSIKGATVHSMSLDAPLWKRPFLSLKARRIIAALEPGTVVLEGPAFAFGIRAKKIVQMIHDSKFATRHRRRAGRMLWLYYYAMCRMCDATLTVSKAERDRIASSLRLDPARILVSYNGIDDRWLKPHPTNNTKVHDVLYVSNFAPHKGHLRLLSSLRGRGLRVAFVGGDLGTLSDTRAYAKAMGLEVSFFSGLSTEELITVYDSARVFAFPSELEGFGIPFLEARARGIPVIASDLAVFRELAAMLGGRIVNFDDPEAVGVALAEAFKQPQPRPELSDFRWSEIADRLVNQIF